MFNDSFDNDVRRCIEVSTHQNVECGFRFNERADSKITIGSDMNVYPETVDIPIGVFHTHTLINSQPSVYDAMSFSSEPESVKHMCLAIPTDEFEEEWKLKCYTRDMTLNFTEVVETNGIRR